MSNKTELQNLFKTLTHLTRESTLSSLASLKSTKCIKLHASEVTSLNFYRCPDASTDDYFRSLKFFTKCTKLYASKAATDSDKVESLLGNRKSEFDTKVEAKLNSDGCSDALIDSYFESINFIELNRCIGLNEIASLEAIDEML